MAHPKFSQNGLISPQRHLFDIPDDVAYFNTAYNAAQLRASTNRLVAAAAEKGHPWQRQPRDFFDDAETVRGLAAGLFGGTADHYAIVPAASYGMSTAARAIEPHVAAGDEILVLEEAFPSNFLPWARLAAETGARIVTVPTPADMDWTQAILTRFTARTRVVATPHCHWTNGAVIDLVRVADAVRAQGAVLAVDASQSLGAMPIDLDVVRPDFLVAAGYKWLLAPYGFSLLYVGTPWHMARPLEESWQARDNATDFASLVKYSAHYMPGARRFDVGEKCTPTILPGAIEALRQLSDWGITSLSATLAGINDRIVGAVADMGLAVPPAACRSPHMFGARLPEGFNRPLVADMAGAGVYVSQRGQALRISPHLHITDRDIVHLLDVLARQLGQ